MEIPLHSHLSTLPASPLLEARLVWDKAARHYTWHLVIKDGQAPARATALARHHQGTYAILHH